MRPGRRSWLAAAAILLAGCSSSTSVPNGPPSTLTTYYAQHLDWQPCDNGFQCARLLVPFDYAHPARIEADDVEPGQHGGRELAARRERVLHARATRAARVHHQVADPVGGVGGRELDDRQGEARSAGAGVVEGNHQAGALEAVLAGLPGQVLRVVGGGRGRPVVRDR